MNKEDEKKALVTYILACLLVWAIAHKIFKSWNPHAPGTTYQDIKAIE